jgi:hypothetical protein
MIYMKILKKGNHVNPWDDWNTGARGTDHSPFF